MFQFGRSPACTLQLYGKLPVAKDYVRIGCSEGAARALRDWMDQAYSTQAAEGRGSRRLAGPTRFLIGTERGTAIVGCLWPSSDAGGLRSFPFALFVDSPHRRASDALDRGLTREESLWSQLETLRSRLDAFGDARELLAALRGTSLEYASTGDSAPSAGSGGTACGVPVEFGAWLAAVWPQAGEAGLRQTFATIRRAARDRREGALVLPLAPALDAVAQVRAWVGALHALGWSGPKALPSLFFPSPHSAGDAPDTARLMTGGEASTCAAPRLLCLRRPLEISDTELLAEPQPRGESVTSPAAPLAPPPAAPPAARAPVSRSPTDVDQLPPRAADPGIVRGAPRPSLAQGLRSEALRFLAATT